MPDNENNEPVRDWAKLSRHQLAAELDQANEAITTLEERGGPELKGLPDDEVDALNSLLDEREQIKAELDKKTADLNKVRNRLRADSGQQSAVRRPHVGGQDSTGTGVDFKSLVAGESEVDKIIRRGPFSSFGHFCHQIHIAGSHPAFVNQGVSPALYEYNQAIKRRDSAIKALPDEVKAASGLNEFSDSEGAVLVPIEFAAGIWQRVVAQESLLSMINPVPVTGNTLKVKAYNDASRASGILYGGAVAYWQAEAGQFSASKPTFRDIELRLNKLYVFMYSTDELLSDAPALQSELTRIAAECFTFKINDAIIRGDGAGQPLGIMNSPAKVAVAKETTPTAQVAATIYGVNIDKMYALRPYGMTQSELVWLYNRDVEPALQSMGYANQMNTSNTVMFPLIYQPAGGISGKPYDTLKGRRMIELEQCETLGTEGDIILFDPTCYACIVKSTGIDSAVSMHLRFDYDETAFRFTFRLDARPRWDAAMTRYKGSTKVTPMVTLAVRA